MQNAGETDLAAMLATLSVEVRPGSYTLVTGGDHTRLGDGVAALIEESEGTTAIVEVEAARTAGLDVGFEGAWLTLEVHSALEAVGLTAAFSNALADRELPCNVLAGYFHDHLLVPADRVDEALDALAELRNGPEPIYAGVTVGNLMTDGDGILLVRETKPAARGRWSIPAGRLERGESLPAAAEREATEETGFDVRAADIVGLYHCPATSEGGVAIHVIFRTEITGGSIRTTAEHPEVRFFTRAEIADMADRGLIRGQQITRAIEDLDAGISLPLNMITEVGASPFPVTD